MRTPFKLAAAALVVFACASLAWAVTAATVIAGGRSTPVRSVQIGGQWYLNADDVARALGRGASFSARTRTLFAGPTPAPHPAGVARTESRVGGPWSTDGFVSVRILSLRTVATFRGDAPDPGAHFVEAVVQLKNVSREPLPLYDVQTTMVKGKTHIDDGQFYKSDARDIDLVDAAPGTTVSYLDVFEISDDAHPDAILVHPPFVPGTGSVDMLIRL